MKIHSEDILDLSEELHSALALHLQWFAYDSSLESVTARDIDLFATSKLANEFKAEKETLGETFQVLPIEPVSLKIDDLIIQSLHESDAYPDVELAISELPLIQLHDAGTATVPISKETAHVISDEVLALAEMAMLKGNSWMVYNGSLYFIDKEDVHFFKSQTEASAFAHDNTSDRDYFHVLEIHSVKDILAKVPFLQEQNILSTQTNQINLKSSIMNENNLKYLKDNLKYTGFGEALYGELEKNIQEKKPEFQLHFTTELLNKPFNATLNFRKGDNSEMYFFNSYKATLEKTNGEKVDQSFPIKKGKGVTAKEAYNLLQGRAVYKDLINKEDQPYRAWVQLDLTKKDGHDNFELNQYHEKYGYDLKEAVGKFHIQEMDGGEAQEKLLKSLEKGNAQSVTMEINGKPEKFFLEANPQYKTVNVYDGQFTLLKHEALPLKQGEKNQQQQAMGQSEKPTEQKQDRAIKSVQKNGDSLLKKKRVGQKKGMKM